LSATQPLIEGKTIFITGGAGFIGSTLAERLVDRNRIVAFDHLARNALEHKDLLGHPNFKLVKGDVLDLVALADAMSGADLVVHCAGVAGIDTVIKRPVETLRVNIVGSFNTVDAARRLDRCERLVCFSTSEIFGQFAFRSIESDRAVVGEVGEARWTYAVGKLAEEHLAIAAFGEWGLPATVLRPFNVYGPGQVGEGALRTFVKKAIANEPIEVHGDGSQIRAWCYVDDMVDATLRALTADGAPGQSFNIGNPRGATTIFDLAQRVVRVLGSQSEIRLVARSHADVELRIPSIDKAERILGFSPAVDLDEGIALTGDHFRGLRSR
jgi:UDP-glucose 4-epimerase